MVRRRCSAYWPGSGALFSIGDPFDQKYWESNNPLEMARTAPLAALKIYFDCGRQDDYGFDAGAVLLDKELSARKLPHEFGVIAEHLMHGDQRRRRR